MRFCTRVLCVYSTGVDPEVFYSAGRGSRCLPFSIVALGVCIRGPLGLPRRPEHERQSNFILAPLPALLRSIQRADGVEPCTRCHTVWPSHVCQGAPPLFIPEIHVLISWPCVLPEAGIALHRRPQNFALLVAMGSRVRYNLPVGHATGVKCDAYADQCPAQGKPTGLLSSPTAVPPSLYRNHSYTQADAQDAKAGGLLYLLLFWLFVFVLISPCFVTGCFYLSRSLSSF